VREEEPSRFGDSQEDIALTNDVEELLATRMAFPRADEIHVWTHDRTITMDGWVKTAEEAAQAQLLAQQVAGVKSVQNRLVVTDGSTGGDEALNQEIRHAFGRKGDAVSPVDALSVVVQQVAYLWGDVDTPEQSLEAEALAKDVPGITRVINYLRVVTRRSRPSSGTTSD
jgi:osmotically-inducible protein OsmY